VIKLYPWQERAVPALISCLRNNGSAADMSEGGTGKTFSALVVAKEMGLRPLVLCPKTIIPPWRQAAEAIGVEPVDILTYEKLRAGNTPYVRRDRRDFVWDLPVNTLVIGDEAHRFSGVRSQISKMMSGAKRWHSLLLSATLAEGPHQLRAAGYLLGISEWELHKWEKWCLGLGCKKDPWQKLYLPKYAEEATQTQLAMMLFPDRAFRVRIKELGDAFPETLITVQSFDIGDPRQIDEYLQQAACANALVEQLRARQMAEALKAPGLIDLARDSVAEGYSVAIFTNFRETLEAIRAELKCPGVYGGQSSAERQAGIDAFQEDRVRYICVNVEAGGVGLSLQDIRGQYPRRSLICPPWSGKSLRQVLWRVHRAGGKSKSLQTIVVAAGTIEEKVRRRVEAKLHCLDLLNDNDLALNDDVLLNESELSGSRLHKPPPTCKLEVPTTLTALEATPDTLPTTVAPSHADNRKDLDRPPGPSGLLALCNCFGFLNEEGESGPAAEDGKRAHKACELEDPEHVADNERLKTAVTKCLAYVKKLPAYRVHREQKVAIFYGRNGFIDRWHENGNAAEIIDYKFSRYVYDADGPQFWAYCVTLWDMHPHLETIRVHVPHPFLDKISVETFRREDYERLKTQVLAILARRKTATQEDYRVTAHCAYCARAGRCGALAKTAMPIVARYEKAPLPELPEGTLHGSEITDPDVFGKLLPWAPVLQKAAGGWSHAALELALSETVSIPGHKLVPTKGRSKIVAPATTLLLLKEVGVTDEEFATTTEVSITKAEELYASRAPKRQMGKWKQEFRRKLTDADALEQGKDGWRLVKD
jgi:superfamily II DNA or RNA helicase